METKISEELTQIAEYAREEAMRTGHYGIGAEHLMLGILRHRDNEACRLLSAVGIGPDELKKYLDSKVSRGWSVPYAEMENIALTREAGNVLNMSVIEAGKCGVEFTSISHLLLALLQSGCNTLKEYFSARGIDAALIRSMIGTPETASTKSASSGAQDASAENAPMSRMFIYPYASTQSECS